MTEEALPGLGALASKYQQVLLSTFIEQIFSKIVPIQKLISRILLQPLLGAKALLARLVEQDASSWLF